MTNNEAFYDKEIAPKLRELAEACEARGMAFVAMVEYDPGESGETYTLPKNAGIKSTLAYFAVKCHGNIDTLVLAASKHASQHGHSSMVLSRMGVPTTPPREGDSNG